MAGAFYMASSVVNYLAFGNAVSGNVLTDFDTQTGVRDCLASELGAVACGLLS